MIRILTDSASDILPAEAEQLGVTVIPLNVTLEDGSILRDGIDMTPTEYYAHLASSRVQSGQWVARGSEIGTVGDSGNARGKPLHLHYSIVTLLPHLWRWDDSRQGWKKIFYLNPDPLLQPAGSDTTAPRPD